MSPSPDAFFDSGSLDEERPRVKTGDASTGDLMSNKEDQFEDPNVEDQFEDPNVAYFRRKLFESLGLYGHYGEDDQRTQERTD